MSVGPLVSVIMCMYNAERFLEAAIGSVLEQTYENLEFIIVDDGSTDRSWEIAAGFGRVDQRIRLIRLEKNQGVSAACNTGLKVAKGKYIGRMDADDVSLPDRLSKQVAFMETHPDIGVLGSKMRYMDESGKLLGIPPQFYGDLSIRWNLFFESPFFNPTILLRKSLLDQYDLQYDPSSVHGEEDYELWSRLLLLTKGENLPDVLLHYRLHPSSISHRYVELRHNNVVNISARAVKTGLPNAPVSWQEVVDLQKAFKGEVAVEKYQRAGLLPVYFKLWEEFRRIHVDESGLDELEQDVIAWAARMALYPLFQPGIARSLGYLTARNWRWPLYLIGRIPYFISRRRIR